MSVDDRLRAGLTEYAARLPEPDVELRFYRSLAIHRRRRAARLVGAVSALVAAACAVAVLAPVATGRGGPLWPAGDATPRPTVQGSYAGLAQALPDLPGSSGRWGLDFGDDGRVTASAPRGADRGPEAAGSLRGDLLTTELFAKDACTGVAPGIYTVARVADRVVLEVSRERCAERARLLTGTTWVSTRTTSWNGPRIPEGRWVREVTVDELHERGYVPSQELLGSNFLDDGAGRFHLEFAGARFYVFVEDDDGSLVLGDQGDVSYDALGRWVQNLSLAVEWSLEGDTLTTRNVAPVDGVRLTDAQPDERLVLEGTWRRTG